MLHCDEKPSELMTAAAKLLLSYRDRFPAAPQITGPSRSPSDAAAFGTHSIFFDLILLETLKARSEDALCETQSDGQIGAVSMDENVIKTELIALSAASVHVEQEEDAAMIGNESSELAATSMKEDEPVLHDRKKASKTAMKALSKIKRGARSAAASIKNTCRAAKERFKNCL